jgi:multiple sugar transport system substrate-binding protein
MVELNFSIYGDQPSLFEGNFLDDFQSANQVRLNVTRMSFNDAWPRLLDFSINGGGPDVSLIGSIWTSSLEALNVLRPISSREIEDMGGKNAFWPGVWQNTLAPGGPQVWGIPFTGYTYFVLYRRDLLDRAGIDDRTAFSSPEAMAETVRRLRDAGISSPLVLPSGESFRARVHCAASWIWAAGGDFVSEDGQSVLFTQPKALDGLSAFFNLYRFLSPADHNLTYDECLKRVATGKAAVTLSGMQIADSSNRFVESPQDIENLGSAPMPGVPWIGGSNLVIWRDVRMDPVRERNTLLLARYLTSQPVQVAYSRAVDTLPAVSAALAEVAYPLPSLQTTFEVAMRTGRAYKPALIWVRILNDLRRAFDTITASLLADTTSEPHQVVANTLKPLARRFELMLGKQA